MADNNILELGKEILKRVDIVDIISAFLKVSKKGKNYWTLCPFHDDHDESLCISKEKQIFTCWPCKITGDAITFVKKYKNCSYKDALKIICEIAGINDERLNQYFVKRVVDEEKEQIYKCLNSINDYYKGFLTQTDEGRDSALKYLHDRGLDDETIEKFNIGYSLKNGDYIVKRLLNDGYSLKTIEKTGIGTIYDGSIKDSNAGRVIFAITNTDGQVVGFSARRLNDNENESKYKNSPETKGGVFHKSSILYNYSNAFNEAKRLKHIYVVEGFMDAIAIDRIGIKNVCALMGVAFTKEHINILRYLNCEVRFCLDNDSAGQKSMLETIKDLRENNIPFRLVSNEKLYKNKDCDEILKNEGNDALKEYLSNLISEGEFAINYYSHNLDLTNLNDKKIFLKNIIPYIRNIESKLDREFYIKKIALKTDYSISTIIDLLKSNPKQNNDINYDELKYPKKNKVLTRLELNEKVLIHYILTNKEALEKYNSDLRYFVNDNYRNLAKLIDDYVESTKVESYDEKDIINYINSKDDESYNNIINEITDIENTSKLPPYSKESFIESLSIIKTEREKSRDIEAYNENIKGKSNEDKIELAKILLEKRRQKIINKEGK